MAYVIPSVVGSNTAFANASSVSVTVPSGVTVGDLLIVSASVYASSETFTFPSGFSTVFSTFGSAYQYFGQCMRVVTGGESWYGSPHGSVTVSIGSVRYPAASIIAIRNHSVSTVSDIPKDNDSSGADVQVTADSTKPAMYLFSYSQSKAMGDHSGFNDTPTNAASGGDTYDTRQTYVTEGGNLTAHATWWRTDATGKFERVAWTVESGYEGIVTGVYARSSLLAIPGNVTPANTPPPFTFGKLLVGQSARRETLVQWQQRREDGLPLRHRPPRGWA